MDAESPPLSFRNIRCVIGVGSGKGGVGKSTVAVNLAATLARMGTRVGLLDADMYGPSAPTMMGISGSRLRMDSEKHIIPLESHGVKIVSVGFMVGEGDALIWRGAILDKVVKDFVHDVAWGDLDYLIVDLPPGTGDVPLSLHQAIPFNGVLLVTTPQDVAIADVVRCFALYREVNVPVLGLIENMSSLVCPHCEGHVELYTPGGGRDLSKRLDIPLMGEVPFDPKTALCGDIGVPIAISAPASPVASTFREIAQRLTQQLAAHAA